MTWPDPTWPDLTKCYQQVNGIKIASNIFQYNTLYMVIVIIWLTELIIMVWVKLIPFSHFLCMIPWPCHRGFSTAVTTHSTVDTGYKFHFGQRTNPVCWKETYIWRLYYFNLYTITFIIQPTDLSFSVWPS